MRGRSRGPSWTAPAVDENAGRISRGGSRRTTMLVLPRCSRSGSATILHAHRTADLSGILENVLDDDVATLSPCEDYPPVLWDSRVALGHAHLHLDGKGDRIDHAGELHRRPVVPQLHGAAVILLLLRLHTRTGRSSCQRLAAGGGRGSRVRAGGGRGRRRGGTFRCGDTRAGSRRSQAATGRGSSCSVCKVMRAASRAASSPTPDRNEEFILDSQGRPRK